ncbi:tRNA (guanine(26)-N(2))-dimethyltransferase [Gossypium arboreum]|uniref:tRNA (Guanine(26)-N(2))-dimethyltransferase n=1 Tax=Gossypium arboreum TaxID=29729 RepID=A0A0B0MXN2_GOSAR|nr:tRNA (guanine(26)-N(2))-dimethyltransferase [Gossypium arboreum]
MIVDGPSYLATGKQLALIYQTINIEHSQSNNGYMNSPRFAPLIMQDHVLNHAFSRWKKKTFLQLVGRNILIVTLVYTDSQYLLALHFRMVIAKSHLPSTIGSNRLDRIQNLLEKLNKRQNIALNTRANDNNLVLEQAVCHLPPVSISIAHCL